MKFARLILLMFLIVVLIACAKPQEKAREELKKMNIDYTETSFFESIWRGNKEVIDLFLTAGMNPNMQYRQTAMTPLIIATSEGHEEVVNLLLAKGADINAKEKSGNTALMVAVVLNKHLNIAKNLIKNGADVNARNNEEFTALISAAQNGNIEFAKILLNNKADPNVAATTEKVAGWTPLLIAVLNGHVDVVKILIEKGANINVRTGTGKNITALSLAVGLAHADIEQILLSSGAKELEPAVLKEIESRMFLSAKSSYDAYRAGISKDNTADLRTAKKEIDNLLTRFPASTYKAQATAILKEVNEKLAIYGGDIDSIDSIINQQKESKAKQADSERKKYTANEAIQSCTNDAVSVIATKVKELMDKGVNFKKDPGVLFYKNDGGQRYASDGTFNRLIKSSMYDGRLLLVSDIGGTNIWIQPEGGTKINIELNFYKDDTWKVVIDRHPVEFKSIFDVREINTKRDEINIKIVKAIEAAIKYGAK